MNTISSYLTYFFEKVKSQLCDRRNERDRVRVNRFAQLERTDVLVRRGGNEGENVGRQKDTVGLKKRDGKSGDRLIDGHEGYSKPQPFDNNKYPNNINNSNHPSPHQPPTITLPKQPTYKHSITQQHVTLNLQQQQTSSQYQHQLQTIISHRQQIDNYSRQIDQLTKQFNKLQQEDKKRKKQCWRNLYKRVSGLSGSGRLSRGYRDSDEDELDLGVENNNNDEYQQYQLISTTNNTNNNTDILSPQIIDQLYNQDITKTIELKYTKQLINYPYIDKQAYTEIRNLWAMGKKSPNLVIRQLRLNFLQKLTARSFRTLSIGTWLNDQMINGYLQMIDTKCVELNNHYRVLNSFFAQTTFAKSPQVIQRVLRRKNITSQNIIIIAINTGTHWLFASIKNSKVIIHDSIKKDNVQMYIYESSISKELEIIKNFANMFYNREHTIVLDTQYPQQKNRSDCGMFLLCGIKDIVRNYQEWSFDKDDINYKRVQVSLELLNQELHGFDYQ